MGAPMAAAQMAFNARAPTVAALAAAGIFGFAQISLAAPAWLRHALHRPQTSEQRQAAAPPVARYVVDEGGGFVLDRTGHNPLIRFDESPEVWVLFASRAPRGDIIYRNDMGEPVLRATKLGGMTVFTSRRPGGSAAALESGATPLRIPPLGPGALYERLYQASVRCTRAAQHLIDIDALDVGAASDGLVGDAAVVTANAMAALSARPDGKALLARIAKVAFVEGGGPDASLRGGVLTITVAASQGVAGRPSSGKIIHAIGSPLPGAIGRPARAPGPGRINGPPTERVARVIGPR
jgi:hypothetical protein